MKSNLNDTIYFEYIYLDNSRDYTYRILDAQGKQEFTNILKSMQSRLSYQNFAMTKVESVGIIVTDEEKFYDIEWNKEEGLAIYNFIKSSQDKLHKIDTIKEFWNLRSFAPSLQNGKLTNSMDSNGH